MRAIVVIVCLAAVSNAQKKGYNYQLGISETDLSTQSGSSVGIIGSNSDVSYSDSSYSTSSDVEKEFYTFSAPETEFESADAIQKMVDGIKQNIRVIFIKGPENKGVENAALTLAKHVAEQKTAIYVLNKQADIAELSNKFNVINKNINHKPEVHFVKYRTSEDAVKAQKAIQSQYDSLAGSSQSHDNSVAAVLNFASQAPGRTSPSNIPSNTYLPSSVVRRRL